MEISEIAGLSPADLDWMRRIGVQSLPRITRSQFEALSPSNKMAVVRAGIVLRDDPEPQQVELKPGEMKRAEFDRMSVAEKYVASRSVKIID